MEVKLSKRSILELELKNKYEWFKTHERKDKEGRIVAVTYGLSNSVRPIYIVNIRRSGSYIQVLSNTWMIEFDTGAHYNDGKVNLTPDELILFSKIIDELKKEYGECES